MTDLPAFGPFLTGADVERAALATLKLWTPEYLAWAERETGRAPRSLPAPRSWVTSTGVDRWPEQQLPSVLLLSTGIGDEPARDGRGTYRAKFSLGLAVVVSAKDKAATLELARVYTATFRALLLQQRLGDFPCEAMEWAAESWDAVPSDGKRQLAAGQLVLRADVRDVAQARAPRLVTPREDPYETPYPDGPTVATTDVDVRPEEPLT